MTPPETDDRKSLRTLVHAVFFISGITTVLIGQVLPILAERFSLNDLEAAYFFPAQFAGSLLGTLITTCFGRRQKFDTATLIGAVSMAVGVLVMNSGSLGLCLTGFVINGIGIGLTLPSINMLILELNPLRTAAALSILNFCWGAGAIICKPFVDYTGRGGIAAPTIILAGVLMVCSVLMIKLPSRSNNQTDSGPDTGQSKTADVPVWSTPLAWILALFNFVHVGFESGMGGWLTTYTGRIEGVIATDLFSPTFLYFLFFVIGRATAPLFFRFVNENVMLLISLGLILVGMAATLAARDLGLLSVGACISGFGTSSIFPTTVSRFGRIFGPSAPRKATPLFICGTLGAATVNWLIGFLSNQMSDLRSGMFVLAASVLILIAVQVGLMIKIARRPISA